jgi:hypothetical protein
VASTHFFFVRCKCFRAKQEVNTEPVFENLFRSPGIDSQPGGIYSVECLNVYKYGLSTVSLCVRMDKSTTQYMVYQLIEVRREEVDYLGGV